ncbi:MAG: hypothetical protein K2P64_01265 [Lachnospiraceae bacterium]|nr:hypothetical protein [Lachnospiraceae bacterium]
MMSKNSSCRTKKIHSGRPVLYLAAQMRENMKRRLWLLALVSFVMLFCYPLTTALTLNRYQGNEPYVFFYRHGLGHNTLGFAGGATVFLLTLGGILCAVEGFSWIYSRKKTDMYLSQPITAGRRFLMIYLNGILLYFIPYTVSVLLTLLVLSGSGAVSGALFLNILFTLPSALIYFLAVYNLTLIAMLISGKRGTAGFFILMGFLYDVVFRAMFESYSSTYFATYAGREGERQFLSPIGRVVVMLDHSNLSWGTETVTTGMVIENLIKPLLPGIFALFAEAVVFGAIAWLCYKKRPMEAVAQAVAFPAVRGPVKVLLMLLAGLLGSACFCDISGNNGLWVALSGLVFGVLFCQVLLEIIYAGDLKAFGRNRKSFAVGALAAVFMYLFFALDIGGYDTWVPKQENVESAAIQIYFGNNYMFDYVDENGMITWKDSERIDEMEMTDVSAVLSLAGDSMGKDVEEPEPDTRLRCDVKYTMKNGKEKYRSFYIDWEKEKTVLDILFANKEYKEGTHQVLSEDMDRIFEKSRVYYSDGLREKEVADKNALPFMRAYRQDLREMSFSDVKDTLPCGTIRLRYRVGDAECMLEYPVLPNYKKTVEYLRGKNIELYLNINPEDVESIRFTKFMDEDVEVTEKSGFFGTSVSKSTAEIAIEREYRGKAQIGEILGYLYPASLVQWAYVQKDMAEDIIVRVREADNPAAWHYDWDENFIMKKGELPGFVKKDMEGE